MTDCGFMAYCGRRERHRGHHGGWRTHVHAVAENPVLREDVSLGGLGWDIGPQQLRVSAEVLSHGSMKDAAACLGLAEATVKNHVAAALAKTGAVSYGHLGVVLGWTTFPAGLGHTPIDWQAVYDGEEEAS